MMKLLITALGLAVLAYACQNEFASAQKLSEKDGGFRKTFFGDNQAQAQSFPANSSKYIFTNTEKQDPIVLPENSFKTKNKTPVTGRLNVEMKEMTTAGEVVSNNAPKQSHGYQFFPAVDFLFVSLIMAN